MISVSDSHDSLAHSNLITLPSTSSVKEAWGRVRSVVLNDKPFPRDRYGHAAVTLPLHEEEPMATVTEEERVGFDSVTGAQMFMFGGRIKGGEVARPCSDVRINRASIRIVHERSLDPPLVPCQAGVGVPGPRDRGREAYAGAERC